LAASDVSCDIAEKSRVNEVAEIDGVLPEEPELGDELPPVAEGELLLLEQAARARPVVMASVDVQLILVNMFKQITSRVRRGQRGRHLASFRACGRCAPRF
jgi:hypothetical protein